MGFSRTKFGVKFKYDVKTSGSSISLEYFNKNILVSIVFISILLPPTQKKVEFDFFALRIIRFWEKAKDFLNLIGQFGFNYFPGFSRLLKKISYLFKK